MRPACGSPSGGKRGSFGLLAPSPVQHQSTTTYIHIDCIDIVVKVGQNNSSIISCNEIGSVNKCGSSKGNSQLGHTWKDVLSSVILKVDQTKLAHLGRQFAQGHCVENLSATMGHEKMAVHLECS